MHASDAGYGLWLLAAINAAFFIFLAFSGWQGFSGQQALQIL